MLIPQSDYMRPCEEQNSLRQERMQSFHSKSARRMQARSDSLLRMTNPADTLPMPTVKQPRDRPLQLIGETSMRLMMSAMGE